MFQFLAVLTLASYLGLTGWRILFNNFAVEIANLQGNHIGIIQSVREIPGFLALLAVFVLLYLKEHKLAILSVFVMGLGVGITGFFPSFGGLVFTTLLMSFGFHYFETMNQSLTLQNFNKITAPLVFGKLRSLGALSNIVTGIIVFTLGGFLAYRQIFLFLGSVVVLAAFWAGFQKPDVHPTIPQHKKMIFRKRYWLYYFLTFMAGARRQIFVAFAVFLLVKIFQFSIREITILFVINNVINYFLSPLIGKAIVKFGERKVLSSEYFSLIFIFTAYALVQSKLLVGILYIFDHIFFNFSMAIKTYFQKICDPKDISPSMAVGFTINHIAAVIFPAIGGLIWMIDYRIPFFVGAGLSLISLAVVQKIPKLR